MSKGENRWQKYVQRYSMAAGLLSVKMHMEEKI